MANVDDILEGPLTDDGRRQTTFIDSVKFTEFERLLADKFGERFKVYRADYYRSLNYDKNGFIPDFPITLTMELVNRCNLDCIMCYTQNHNEEKETLGFERIRRILSECEENGLPALVLGLGSEPLLFKGAREVMADAANRGVMDIFLGTNGVLLTPALSDFLVEQQIARVEISLDAATPETYLEIRRKNELERIEANIHALIEAKRRKGSTLPVIRLCFCVMDINKHESEAFLERWQGKVDYVDFQKFIDFQHVDELRETGTVKNLDALEVKDLHCAYPFNSLHVWANGNVTPCCTFFARNPALSVGNIAFQSLREIWNGPAIKEIRRQLLTGDLNPTCKVCLSQRGHDTFEEVKAQRADAAGDQASVSQPNPGTAA